MRTNLICDICKDLREISIRTYSVDDNVYMVQCQGCKSHNFILRKAQSLVNYVNNGKFHGDRRLHDK